MAQEAAEVNAALDAALETGHLDYDDSGVLLGDADGDAEVGMDGDADADVDPDESVLEAEPTILDPDQPDTIRVFVRVRPPSAREGSAPCRDIVRVDSETHTVHLLAEPCRAFTFDGVLSKSAAQDEVFKLVGTSVGEACLNGYNGSIYVYGQTGSGKTYTMQGPVASVQAMHANERRGIMCRILELIFAEVGRRHSEGGNVEYRCKCSYLEIYREQITDLLEQGSTNLQVREDINRGVYVEKLSEHTVWTVADAFHVLWKGFHQRHVSATTMNEMSSRSHAVFTLVLEAASTTSGGVTSTRSARLNLIDLAGSERQNNDPHNMLQDSLRVKEAGAINKSLSALTNVIMSLSRAGQKRRSAGGQRQPFVHFRDSKLTFLLRDSLGGNSRTVIVANISPSALCFGETLSTLKFAARAKHIRCTAVMNEEYSGTVESLMLEVKSLKQQLTLLSSRGLIPGELGTESQASFADIPSARAALGVGDADLDDEQMEAILTRGNDDLRRLYGPRRVRRLEILLAAALERERRCELRRHKLDKFTQYLDGLLERKERYFDGLRDYYALLVESAAAEGCYPPDLVQNLVAFRQQLCRVPTEGRILLDNDEGQSTIVEEDESMDQHQQQQLPTSPEASGMRNNSYGLLVGEVARRNRRGTSQTLLQKASLGRLSGASTYSPSASSALISSAGVWFSADASPEEVQVSMLRTENKLLRRQLESHPELHRFNVENRLLREHLASLIQQHAVAHEEPPWAKGHRHARRANDGLSEDSKCNAVASLEVEDGMLREEPSLTRMSKSSAIAIGFGEAHDQASLSESSTALLKTSLAQALKTGGDAGFQDASVAEETEQKSVSYGPFPGIEDATQISQSSSDAGDADDSDPGVESSPSAVAKMSSKFAVPKGGRPTSSGPSELGSAAALRPGGDLCGAPGTADASSFLPTMAREVEELLHVKGGLEDALKQFICSSRANNESDDTLPSMAKRVRSATSLGALPHEEVEPRMASEILRGTSEALQFAEGMLAKGKGDALLLSANGGADEEGSDGPGTALGASSRVNEGLDERDVFLSLMRSLPSEGPSLSRHGFASSAPHLSPIQPMTGTDRRRSYSSMQAAPPLRLSSSTASGMTSLSMMRNRSKVQLHSIVEQPQSPRESSARQTTVQELEPQASAASDSGSPVYSEEVVKEAAQKVKQLCHHLELISDAYRDMREQFKPLQDEYVRRLDKCRFLEAQCRRLDVHCRLLEERSPSMGGGSQTASLVSLTGGSGALSRFQRLPINVGAGGRPGHIFRGLSDSTMSRSSGASWGTLSADGSRELLARVSPPVTGSPMPGAVAATASSGSAGARPWAWGVASSAGTPTSVGDAASRSVNSPTILGSASSVTASGKAEVPPRGLLYAASVSELCLDSQRPQGSKLLGPPSAALRTADYIRRVASAPQLPAPQLLDRQVLPHGGGGSGMLGRAAASGAGSVGVAAVPFRGPLVVGVGATAEEEASSVSGAFASAGASASEQSSFDSSTFLSLAQQPGRKGAALQYLISSTRNALGTIGESTDSGAQSPSKTPGASPTRSASVGSLGVNIGGISGGLPPASMAPATFPKQVSPSVYSGATAAARRPIRPLGPGGSAGAGAPQGADFGRAAAIPRSVGLPVRPATAGLSGLAPGNVMAAGRRQNSVGQVNNSGIANTQLGGPPHRLA